MGDSQPGGGASVHWKLDVNDVRESHDSRNGSKHHQDGIDEEGRIGDFFTVSIKRPADGSPLTMNPDGDRVYINVEIEDDRGDPQIRVSWGNSDNHRGKGGARRPVV